jgi:hypothetical protein
MPDTAGRRFIDYLPAVFRQDEVEGVNFLGRFLQAFESVFAEVQREFDAISGLFAVIPTPVVVEANAGGNELRLDSAAGLCQGDILHLRDANLAQVEFVEVKAVSPDPLPSTVTLNGQLRFMHIKGTPVRVVGQPGPAARISLPLSAGAAALTVAEAEALGVASGDVLRIDEGGLTEYAQVVSVVGASVTVTPALGRAHEVWRPVVLMQPASQTTPPLAFAHASRLGAELLLRAPAWAGETALELDTITGLQVGDILHLRELDPAQAECGQVKALPPDSNGPSVLRFAIRLERPLRFNHAMGLAVGVLRASTARTRLSARLEAGATALMVDDPASLDAVSGDVLQIDEGAAAECAQVLAVSGQRVTLTPPLQQSHGSGRPVMRMALSGSGTAFVQWLGSWIGLALRPDRAERWNRELLRLAGRIWRQRGTKVGVEAFLNAYLSGEAEATVRDLSNPLQLGLVSTIGVDTIICGDLPYYFSVDLVTDRRHSQLYHPLGLAQMVQAAHGALRQEKPAHTYYDLRLQAHTMQLGVDPEADVGARVGDTTLLWEAPLVMQGHR